MATAVKAAFTYPDIPNGRKILLKRARIPLCLIGAVPEALTWAQDPEGSVLVDLLIDGGKLAALWSCGQGGVASGAGLVERVDQVGQIDQAAQVDRAERVGQVEQVDLAGRQVWPMFVDCHAHLDKTQTLPRAQNPDGTFSGARAGAMADRLQHWSGKDIERRMEFALRCAAHHGTAAIRTHLDSHEGQAELTWEVFQGLREKWRDRITLQGVALVGPEVYTTPFGERLLDMVSAAHGVVGGFLRLPDGSTRMPDDLGASLDRLFERAALRGLDVDLHVDETGNPASRMLEQVARSVLRTGFQGQVVCGHCCSLAMQPAHEIERTLESCVAARVGIVTLPTANLYLQDRHSGTTPRWRGVTLVREMLAAGLTVAVGGDNVRDPFFPYGDNDMLDTLRQAVRIAHLDHPIVDAPRLSGPNAAQLMGLREGLLHPGADARLVLFNARSINEILSRPQSDRLVLDRGRIGTEPLPGYEELDGIPGGNTQ